MLQEYTKIETVYARDLDGSKKLKEGVFRNKAVEYLKNNNWIFTEKVDGTNVRVYWDGHKVSFHGRTDKANLPPFLVEKLTEIFATNEMEQVLEQMFGEKEVILFGEGYGNKIQKCGAGYIPDGVDFILFDVKVGGVYLSFSNVVQIGKALGVKVVPFVCLCTIDEAVAFVKSHPVSLIASAKNLLMEGLVGQPEVPLRDGNHDRIMVKIKVRDFE